MKHKYLKYLIPLIIGVAALFIPLIRDFHIESAMIAATVGAFWAGISATRFHKNDFRKALEILGWLYLAGLPLLLYTLILGCYTVHGLGIWLLLPGPSLFFGYAVGRLMRRFRLPLPKMFTFLILLLVAVGGFIYEFISLSQLYFFNHIWGWWPGPIYDEAVQLSGSLVAFRFMTICWTIILWLVPDIRGDLLYRWIIAFATLALLLSYTQLERMGIVTSEEYLQQRLGDFRESEHARIYFAESYYTEREIDRLESEIEFYISRIKDALHISIPDSSRKIELYLYAHPWQKKELVGAKYTSYVTVWKETPQIHIAKEQIDGSLKHEAVHAVTALLEEPWILPNIGLTEGVAVALAPDRSPRSTIDQLVAAQKPYPTAEQMESFLSYWGFYTGRSAVSYTSTGSFVKYLLKAYPPENFVRAYEAGSLEDGYKDSIADLVKGWHNRLDSVAVDSSDRQRAREIFSQPSLFEQHCPHRVPREAELLDQYRYHLAEKDTAGILSSLEKLKQLDVEGPLPKLLWTSWNLRAGRIDSVIAHASMSDTVIDQQLLYSDAYKMRNRMQSAEEHLARAIEMAAEKPDTTYDDLFANRLDSLQWRYDLQVRFDDARLDSSSFRQAYYLLKIRSFRNALEQDRRELLPFYASVLLSQPASLEYFNTYLNMIHRLALIGDIELASSWIQKLSDSNLPLRFREQLQQEREWISFLKNR